MAAFVPNYAVEGRPVLVASGEVDIAAVDGLLTAAQECLDRATAEIEIDLGEVTFIDSSGLGALVQIRKLAGEGGLRLVVSHVPRPVQRLFDLTGLDDLFSDEPGQ